MDRGFFPRLSIGSFLYVQNNKNPIIIAIITIDTTLHPCQQQASRHHCRHLQHLILVLLAHNAALGGAIIRQEILLLQQGVAS
jgi:hypothetical protein